MNFRAALCLAFLSCAGSPVPVPTPPPTPQATCAAACERQRALGCPGGQASPGGASCEEVCLNVQDSVIGWDLGCRARATSCEAADRCEAP